jgi:uncharacterized protein YndB with AHSA1/START domain
MTEQPATNATQGTQVRTDGITIWRVFEAPRELVWKAWTEPEQFAQWWGERDSSIPLETASMDVRPGGAWSVTMLVGPDRTELVFAGEYREVAAPERLVLTLEDPFDRGLPEVEVMTVTLTELGDGRTQMVFNQTGSLPEDEYRQAAQGVGTFFDRLAEHLAQRR